jgi:hypothetical protein
MGLVVAVFSDFTALPLLHLFMSIFMPGKRGLEYLKGLLQRIFHVYPLPLKFYSDIFSTSDNAIVAFKSHPL